MKKFVFTLQTLYDIKLAKEKQLKQRMRAIESLLEQLRKELDKLLEEYRCVKRKYFEEAAQGAMPERMQDYCGYLARLGDAATQKRASIRAAEMEREKCLREQVELMKEIKSLEKLYETQYGEYLSEAKAETEKAVGDFVAYQAVSS